MPKVDTEQFAFLMLALSMVALGLLGLLRSLTVKSFFVVVMVPVVAVVSFHMGAKYS